MQEPTTEFGLKYKGTITINRFQGATIERGPNGRLRHVPGTGNLISSVTKENVFLNTGKTWAIVRLFDDHGSATVSGTAAHAFYVGTTVSAGSEGAGDTTADTTEIAREAFVYATGGVVGQMSGTATFVSATANGAITEAGIFAGSVLSGDGTFVARAMFAVVNKASTDTLQVKWDVTIA